VKPAAQRCMRCLGQTKQPWLQRDSENPKMAICPVCGFRMPNGDGRILFIGRPPKMRNANED
jgi:DNA-directed RNA polymerase subunit RPC12/RpoP